MKLVVIESPLAGDFARNQRYARLCSIDCLRRGESPYASHLFFTQMLDDRNSEERNLGIEAGYEWARSADIFAFYTDLCVSNGMLQALKKWERLVQFDIPMSTQKKDRIQYRELPPDLLALLDSDEPLKATPGAA